MIRPASQNGGNGRAVSPGALRGAGDDLKHGDRVVVTDPDGETWVGRLAVPSVLWDGWWVVWPMPGRSGRTGKGSQYHVHVSEMTKRGF